MWNAPSSERSSFIKASYGSKLRIGMVVGELSGDILGAGLIHALRSQGHDIFIEGIGGPRMLAVGFHSHVPIETLSVMGLTEVIKHYPRLRRCYATLRDHFLQHPPDLFVGIDAPDFNLNLECELKAAGIPTVHYVSPSLWAWRQYRLRKVIRACDLMLTLFPFEAEFYHHHHFPVHYVGHPLADEVPLESDKQQAREYLNLPVVEGPWVALLPGSRLQEVSQLGPPFLQTAQWLLARYPKMRFIVPLVNHSIKTLFVEQLSKFAPQLPIDLFDGQSHQVIAAADVVLSASGTATLETMLLKRPMVVAYRLSRLTYCLAKPLVKIRYFALPNLLSQEVLVPEFIQNEVIPEHLGKAVLNWLENPARVKALEKRFTQLHHQLRQSANQQAAQAVFSLIQTKLSR